MSLKLSETIINKKKLSIHARSSTKNNEKRLVESFLFCLQDAARQRNVVIFFFFASFLSFCIQTTQNM